MKCPICNDEFEPKRADAKTCGKPACRKQLQRLQKTNNQPEALAEPEVPKSEASTKPPCPSYMNAAEYERWEENNFAMCKFGECLNKDCKFRVTQ